MANIMAGRYAQPPPLSPYSYAGYQPPPPQPGASYAYDPTRQRFANPVELDDGRSYAPQGLEREVFQHGSIGEFITSSIEGVESGFLRCIYRAKNDPDHTVTLLCEKIGGCCVTGCCPKDQFWMTGLIILLIFVLLVFCGGAIAIIFCYQRSKNSEKRSAEPGFHRAESANSEAAIYSHDPRPHSKITSTSPFGDYNVTDRNTLRRTY